MSSDTMVPEEFPAVGKSSAACRQEEHGGSLSRAEDDSADCLPLQHRQAMESLRREQSGHPNHQWRD